MISPALAHGSAVGGTSGGGIALLIIIGVAIAVAFAYAGQKKWRARRMAREDAGK